MHTKEHKQMQKYIVKQTVTYYAEVAAASAEAAVELAEELGRTELDADAVEGVWETVIKDG